uniref:Uncharacterized protein n=1 Tax=Zea mays TaxID=4577 RepID=C4J2Q4_MAIZE|nr:unknown [Zea mays]
MGEMELHGPVSRFPLGRIHSIFSSTYAAFLHCSFCPDFRYSNNKCPKHKPE